MLVSVLRDDCLFCPKMWRTNCKDEKNRSFFYISEPLFKKSFIPDFYFYFFLNVIEPGSICLTCHLIHLIPVFTFLNISDFSN